ncbi:MAG: hypothetical protein NTV34_00985 [Proteobacteria bacterium]|nr:hypothetical protein [Pseudomonadota bacterium]
MDWIPATPEAWRAASELIIRNRDLVRLLPDMFSSFTGNACHYFKNGLDDALWSPWQENSPKEATEIFLYAVSLIHHFVEHYDADEKYLWQARAQFDRIAKIKPGNDGPGRAEFVAAQDQIKSTSAITEVERKRKLGCLRIAVHGAFSSDQVIDEYLETTQSSAIGFIDTLAEHAWLHRNLLTFLKIISRYSNITSLSPTLLNRTWAAAAEIENYDLAWRIATIAATRTGLTKQVRSHWEICGERRKAYNPQTISPGEREIALYNLPDALKRLFNSMFVLGPKLTELAGIMKRPGFAPRNALIPVSTQEKSIEKAITQSGFTSSGKRVMDRVGSHEISAELSTLVFDLDSGPWSYAAKTILERISAPCWGYEFDNLRALCRCLTPSLKPKERESSTSSLGRWFNKLSEEERAAWSDLVVAVNRYDGCEFGKHLARVVTRMATLIYPSHFLALSDLQKTKAPLSLIHDLESFVLSQKYTGLRFQRCIHIRIAVPEGLRRVAITE